MKVIVHIIESEAGWGQKVDEVKTFRSVKAAKAFITKYNAYNNEKTVPSWYMYARLVSIDGMEVV